MTTVQVARRKNGLLLVEWQDDGLPKRAWVTQEMVVQDHGDTADVDEPNAGIPYGVEFWRLLQPEKVTAKDLDKELKRRGIWTVADLRANPNVALSAIATVYGINLSALLQAADKYEKDLTEVFDGRASL